MELEEVLGLNPVEGIDDLDDILNFDGPIIKETNTNFHNTFGHDIFSQVFHKTEHEKIFTNNILSPTNANNCTELMFVTQKDKYDNTINLENTTENVFPMMKTEFITSLCFDKLSEQNTQLLNSHKKEDPPLNFTFNEALNTNQQISTNPTQLSLGLSFLQPSNNDVYSHSVKVNPQPVAVNLTKDISLIPKSVLQLYQIVRESFSDFSFVYAISAQMCQDFLPMDSFVNLKMVLLLSLASIENDDNKRMPLPIIAFGQDSSSINAIMNHFGNISKRFITPLDDFQSVSIGRDNMIEAGPMLLAKGGVCYLGDWSRIKPGNADKILKELESGQALLDKMQITFPIQSAVWCYWSTFKNTSRDLNTLNTLLDIFGIPIIVENSIDDVLLDFLLENNCTLATKSTDDELTIPTYDMKEYLKIVSRRSVDMTTEANKLLQKYFIASRFNRPNCLTQKSFIILQQLSESFAKLSFRNEVISVDVIAAIYLAENFIHNIFGPGVYPTPQLSSKNYVGEVDNFLKYFEQWVQEYIEKFASDL